MTASLTLDNRFKLGNAMAVICDLTFDNSYPTGGEAVNIPLNVIKRVLIEQQSPYYLEYDHTNKKVKVYRQPTVGLVPVSFAGIQGAITASKTHYIGPNDNAMNETEDVFFIAPVAGTLSNLCARLGTAPGAAEETTKTLTLTVRKNGADTGITGAIAADATTVSDTTHTATVAAGDRISIKGVSAASTAAADLCLSLLFKPDAAEVANATDLSALSVKLLAIGY